ncbi:ABC transporter permease [Bordetella pertussis]|uniref:ABC transporter permease n=1 Tax=Bordetella pertussis TaxID=520 RepID=UPI0005DD86C2|nr:ABC transporter permease [Bordetella pertussis]CFN30042.1 ABC transporter permease [Bordetella pertussis]CFO15901.1 ABC transporter permease [Bordetella pertussis]CFO39152.1 ABC transporter permease [Bordetella pertussis]CFP25201.1 ABC transporter permease [Bordetella pertussis]CFT71269.1 ABC transporter permease [Bordetella pertussis]
MRRSLPALLVLPAAVLIGGMFLLPVLRILAISFTEPHAGLGNYAALFTEPLYLKIMATTARICAWTTLIALGLGYVLAYVMANSSPRMRSWMIIGLLVPFWLSVLVRAFAWVLLLAREGPVNATLMALGVIDSPLALLRNETGVLIGMVHYMIPYAVLPMLTNMLGIDRSLMAAARALGAGPVATFLRVSLPLSLPGVLAAGVLVFIFSLGFFITPALLGGGKTVMVAQYIEFGISETMNWGISTAFAATLLVAVIMSLVLVSRVVRVPSLFGAP